jgi:hypothetical protein
MSNDSIIASLTHECAAVAKEFLVQCPDAILTSGRRSVQSQASAMGADVAAALAKGDPNFIQKTYRNPLCPAAKACQDWVTARGACLPGETVSSAFLGILKTFPDSELTKLSRHLGGMAFDIHVDGDARKENALAQLATKCNGTFLRQEGGLARWHWQLNS